MHPDRKIISWPALSLAALALFFLGATLLSPDSSAQKIKQLPPPPPGPRYKPKPTPTPAPSEYDIVRVSSNLVVVPVSVTDAQGQPVRDLKPGDFRIEEDGRPQEIAQLGDPEQVPLDIALLVDVSGSVVARFDFEQEAASRFIERVLKPEDRATVFAIDETPRLVQPLTNSSAASRSLMSIKPSNSYTAFFDSVVAATNYLDRNSSNGRRRIIVVISDGDDTARILTVSRGKTDLIGVEAQLQLIQNAQLDVLHDIQRAEITFYSINPSGQTMRLNVRTARSQTGMERLAAAPGGAALVPAHETDLTNIFNRIASEIRSQYLLQYYSNNQSGSRTFRRFAVTTTGTSELRLRARER